MKQKKLFEVEKEKPVEFILKERQALSIFFEFLEAFGGDLCEVKLSPRPGGCFFYVRQCEDCDFVLIDFDGSDKRMMEDLKIEVEKKWNNLQRGHGLTKIKKCDINRL